MHVEDSFDPCRSHSESLTFLSDRHVAHSPSSSVRRRSKAKGADVALGTQKWEIVGRVTADFQPMLISCGNLLPNERKKCEDD